jgi:hypothetical protein
VTGVTRPGARDQEVPSLGGMVRRFVGVTVGLVVIGALSLAPGDREGVISSYSSVQALGRDINAHGIGCPRLRPARFLGPVGHEAATCQVGSATITLHTFADVPPLEEWGEPTPRTGVSWVVGPNWLVATMDRPAATQVASVIGGDLIPS